MVETQDYIEIILEMEILLYPFNLGPVNITSSNMPVTNIIIFIMTLK